MKLIDSRSRNHQSAGASWDPHPATLLGQPRAIWGSGIHRIWLGPGRCHFGTSRPFLPSQVGPSGFAIFWLACPFSHKHGIKRVPERSCFRFPGTARCHVWGGMEQRALRRCGNLVQFPPRSRHNCLLPIERICPLTVFRLPAKSRTFLWQKWKPLNPKP